MIAMIAIFALYGLDYSLPFQKAGTDLKAVSQSRMIDSWDILDFLFFKHLKMSETIALKQF